MNSELKEAVEDALATFRRIAGEKEMTFDEYQRYTIKRAKYPNVGNNLVYPVLGLCGESGEVAEKIKKSIRDSSGELTEEKALAIAKELGDVLWYVSATAHELGWTLSDVAKLNVVKIDSRNEKGTIHGSGDDR